MSSATERFDELRRMVRGNESVDAILTVIDRLEEEHGLLVTTDLESASTRLEQEGQRRQRAESTLQSIVKGTAYATGRGFFSLLVEHLARALHVEFALVGRVIPPRQQEVEVLAAWAGDGPGTPFVTKPGMETAPVSSSVAGGSTSGSNVGGSLTATTSILITLTVT